MIGIFVREKRFWIGIRSYNEYVHFSTALTSIYYPRDYSTFEVYLLLVGQVLIIQLRGAY